MDLQGFDDWDWTGQALGDEDQTAEDSNSKMLAVTYLDGLVFLVDCTSAMFEKSDKHAESGFELCMKCARNVYQNKAMTSDKDLLSIVFYGTGLTDSGEGKSIHVFQDIGQLSIKRIQDVESVLAKADSFEKTYGHSNEFDMSDVFWACSNVFSRCKRSLGYKRIFLFTNEDYPHHADQSLQKKAIAKATDLYEMGISLELMHMNKAAGQIFDVNAFYKNIIYLGADDNISTELADASHKFEDLLDKVRHKVHKKRTLAKVSWTIGEGLEMSVGVYCLSRRATIPTACRIHRDTNSEVKSSTVFLNKTTGEDIMPQDVKMYRTYANKRIAVEKEELAEIRKLGIKGLKLMGFKHRDKLKDYYHIKPSHFIYPEESIVKGSIKLFTALLQKCLQRDVVPVCWYSARFNSSPDLVYLIPQAEEKDENGLQKTPPGFHVIFMPYAEDFRTINLTEKPTATSEQVDLCKAVMRKMKFTYDPAQFDNPCLQKFQANLEAMALNKDEPDEIKDYSVPDYEKIVKRIGSELEAFKESVFPEGYEAVVAKRSASTLGVTTAKKAKVDLSAINVAQEVEAGNLGKMTVVMLKDICKSNGIKTSATKKADIIEAIKAFYKV